MRLPAFPLVTLSALALTSPSFSAQQVERLVEEARLEEDAVRLEFFAELAGHGTAEAFEALVDCVALMEHEVTRARAMEACAGFVGTPAETAAIDFLYEAAMDEDELPARAAARALDAFGVRASSSLQSLVARSNDEVVRALAVGTLLRLWSRGIDAERLKTVLAHARLPESGTRGQVLRELRHVPHARAAAIYPPLLADDALPAEHRAWLIADLAGRPESVLRPALERLFTEGDDEELQARALEVVLARGIAAPLDWLRHTVREARDPQLRYLAARARDRQETERGIWAGELQRFARSSDPVQRQIAARLAGSLVQEARTELLVDLLADPSLPVRVEAMQTIDRLAVTEAIPELIELLDDAGSVDRPRILATLQDLTRQTELRRADAWRRWWREHGEGFEGVPSEGARRGEHRFVSARAAGLQPGCFSVQPSGAGVVFLLDVSNWMERIVPVERDGTVVRITALELAARELEQAVDALPDGTEVGLITYGAEIEPWRTRLSGLSRGRRLDLAKHLDELIPQTEARQWEGLRAVFELEEVDTVVVIAGGEPRGSAVVDADQVLADLARWNRFRSVCFHSIALFHQSELLRELAWMTGGESVVVQ